MSVNRLPEVSPDILIMPVLRNHTSADIQIIQESLYGQAILRWSLSVVSKKWRGYITEKDIPKPIADRLPPGGRVFRYDHRRDSKA